MSDLIWKDIEGFEGHFKINSNLEVYRVGKNGLIPKKISKDNCYEFDIKGVGSRKYKTNILFLNHFPEIYIERKIKQLEEETNTIWKRVKGYENTYLINEYGLIYKLDFNRFSRGSIKENGYMRITLSKDNVKKEYYTHRLVAFSFLTKIDGKDFVNHKDGNKENNHYSNLEWVTVQENNLHKYRVLKQEQNNCIPVKITDIKTGKVRYYTNIMKAEIDIIGKDTTGFRYCLEHKTLYKKRYKIEYDK